MIGIAGAITAASNLINGVVDRVWPNPTEVEAQKIERLRIGVEAAIVSLKGQLDANIAAAKHASVFVAGARPFIIWVCGFGMLYAGFLEPFMEFIAVVVFDYTGKFPEINVEQTTNMLHGLLGLGGMRSVETLMGKARRSMKE